MLTKMVAVIAGVEEVPAGRHLLHLTSACRKGGRSFGVAHVFSMMPCRVNSSTSPPIISSTASRLSARISYSSFISVEFTGGESFQRPIGTSSSYAASGGCLEQQPLRVPRWRGAGVEGR